MSKVTMSYRSKEKPEMEGPKDMGATLTLEIDSEIKVYSCDRKQCLIERVILPLPCTMEGSIVVTPKNM